MSASSRSCPPTPFIGAGYCPPPGNILPNARLVSSTLDPDQVSILLTFFYVGYQEALTVLVTRHIFQTTRVKLIESVTVKMVVETQDFPSSSLTQLFPIFAQFVANDISLTPTYAGIDCCAFANDTSKSTTQQ